MVGGAQFHQRDCHTKRLLSFPPIMSKVPHAKCVTNNGKYRYPPIPFGVSTAQ